MKIQVRKLDDSSWLAWVYDSQGKYHHTNELTKKYALAKLQENIIEGKIK